MSEFSSGELLDLDKKTLMDRDAELSVVASLIQHPTLMGKYSTHMGEWNFKYTGARIVFSLVMSAYKVLGCSPTYGEALAALQAKLRDTHGITAALRAQYVADLHHTYTVQVAGAGVFDLSKFITLRETGEWLKRIEVAHMGDVQKVLDEYILKLQEISGLSNRADEDPFQSRGISLLTKEGLRLALEEINYVFEPGSCIATPWERLNIALQGGHFIGELIMVIAGPGSGKTCFLVNLAAGAIQQRKLVIYYVMDNTRSDMYTRFLARLYQESFPSDMGSGYTLKAWEPRRKRHAQMLGIDPDNSGEMDLLRIIKLPSLRYSPRQIIQHARDLSDFMEQDIGLLAVDYLEELAKKAIEYRHNLDENCRELRNGAEELRCVVAVGSQGNKESINYNLMTLNAAGEALAKTFAPSVVYGIPLPEESHVNYNGTGIDLMNVCVLKMRRPTPLQVHPILFDRSRHAFVEDPEREPYVFSNRQRFGKGKKGGASGSNPETVTRDNGQHGLPRNNISRPTANAGVVNPEDRKAALAHLAEKGQQ